MDNAYDLEPMYDELEARHCHPIIPLREDTKVKKGFHLPPKCRHGTWKFGGADFATSGPNGAAG
jgi:hypothetical protein